MKRASPAIGGFPYPHRTVAQVEASERLSKINSIARRRSLSIHEMRERRALRRAV